MSTVVTIMDRPGWAANTDVIVVALARPRALVWVPRDLVSPRYGTRVNAVFARHGHAGLRRALLDVGVHARHGVCLQRGLAEELLADVSVEVPVARPLEYRYPLRPQDRLEDGHRIVRFDPPAERLQDVRIHEWLGARIAVGRYAGDLERIHRQQVFLRALLRSDFDPGATLRLRADLWSSTGPAAWDELRRVTADWRSRTIRGVHATHDGQQVTIAGVLPGRLGRWRARLVARRLGARLD